MLMIYVYSFSKSVQTLESESIDDVDSESIEEVDSKSKEEVASEVQYPTRLPTSRTIT